ncbi:unnamed protein product [Prorocentrum cordatum]|uniref:Uncharacterized protein n=1 Tax=Prorocentrum cordatum TaxID=2364126 RepID=A0ABN9QC06_9DINO|nr:unnamed protein product [Polarella glacialis]
MHGALFLLPPLTDRSSSTIVVPCATALVRLHAAAGPRGSPGGAQRLLLRRLLLLRLLLPTRDAGHEAEAAADTRGVSSELRRPLRCSGRRPHSPPAAPGREGTAAGRFALKARSGAAEGLRPGTVGVLGVRACAACMLPLPAMTCPTSCYFRPLVAPHSPATQGGASHAFAGGHPSGRLSHGCRPMPQPVRTEKAGRFTMSLPDAYWTGDQWALAPSGPVDGPFYGLLVPRRPQGNRRPATMPTTPLATPRRRPRCRHSSLSEGKVGKRGVFPSGTPLPGARRAPGAAPEALPGGPAPIQEVRADL